MDGLSKALVSPVIIKLLCKIKLNPILFRIESQVVHTHNIVPHIHVQKQLKGLGFTSYSFSEIEPT